MQEMGRPITIRNRTSENLKLKQLNNSNKTKKENRRSKQQRNKMNIRKKKKKTLRPSTERRPLRMHSLRPVPSTITSYSSSMAIQVLKNEELKRNRGEVEIDLQ